MKSIKKIGCLGLTLFAFMALAGVSSASASLFQAESFPATLSGSGTQTFQTEAGTIVCSTSTQKGEATSSAEWWSVKVTDSGCKLGEGATTVNWSECEIRYYTYSGLYIVCKGGVVKIASKTESGECIIEIGPQELKSVSFTEVLSGTIKSIGATVKVSNMKFTQSKACAGGAGTFTNGTIGGEILLKGFTKEGLQQSIFIK